MNSTLDKRSINKAARLEPYKSESWQDDSDETPNSNKNPPSRYEQFVLLFIRLLDLIWKINLIFKIMQTSV